MNIVHQNTRHCQSSSPLIAHAFACCGRDSRDDLSRRVKSSVPLEIDLLAQNGQLHVSDTVAKHQRLSLKSRSWALCDVLRFHSTVKPWTKAARVLGTDHLKRFAHEMFGCSSRLQNVEDVVLEKSVTRLASVSRLSLSPLLLLVLLSGLPRRALGLQKVGLRQCGPEERPGAVAGSVLCLKGLTRRLRLSFLSLIPSEPLL